jgi:hypothetical protein
MKERLLCWAPAHKADIVVGEGNKQNVLKSTAQAPVDSSGFAAVAALRQNYHI